MEKEKEGTGREGAGDEEAGMGERDEIRRHLLADDTGDSEVASIFLMIATKQSKNLPSTWAGDPCRSSSTCRLISRTQPSRSGSGR